jgi:hypothetical protein
VIFKDPNKFFGQGYDVGRRGIDVAGFKVGAATADEEEVGG